MSINIVRRSICLFDLTVAGRVLFAVHSIFLDTMADKLFYYFVSLFYIKLPEPGKGLG